MRAVVQKRHVGFAKEPRDGAQRAAKAAVEKHRILAAKKFRDAPFEFAMQIGHSREHRRTARAHSVRSERLVCGGQHFRVICEAKIIVRAEIDHRSRLAAIIDHGARICSREEFRLIQLNRPRTDAHPICEARWSLQRVVAFARQKITQAELRRVVVHQTVKSIARSRLHSRRPPAKLIILWFTKFLTKWSAASIYRGVPSRGRQWSGLPNSGHDFSKGIGRLILE